MLPERFPLDGPKAMPDDIRKMFQYFREHMKIKLPAPTKQNTTASKALDKLIAHYKLEENKKNNDVPEILNAIAMIQVASLQGQSFQVVIEDKETEKETK